MIIKNEFNIGQFHFTEIKSDSGFMVRNMATGIEKPFFRYIGNPVIPAHEETDEKVEDWQKEQSYKSKVVSLIRTQYSENDEIAILRQQADKPDEYAEYYEYCEQCKATAKAEIYGG